MTAPLLIGGAADFAGSNNVHPVGLVAVVIASIAMLLVKRTMAPVVLLALASVIPSSQRLVVAGADFNFVRFLVLVGLIRVVMRGEMSWIRINAIDVLMLIGAFARTVCGPIGRGSMSEAVTTIGSNFELVGAYFILRCSIRNLDEVRELAKGAAILCALVVPLFLFERYSGRNMFSVFGGIPEITNVREGKVRCRGAFAHPILAGCFFVAWIPIWIAMALAPIRKDRLLALVGFCSAFLIVFSCASSTPVVALLLGIGVWLAFPLRSYLRILYLSAIAMGFVLHMIMTKPVWSLIARIDLVGGSTGNHRYRLIDAAIKRFEEWWAFGTPTTAHWGWGLFDVTNQFIIEAIRGGIWALLAMCGVFIVAYATFGVELRRHALAGYRATQAGARSAMLAVRRDELLTFGLGAAICAQMAVFLAVSYFGQAVVVWQFFMALAAACRQWSREPMPVANAAAMLERPEATAVSRRPARRDRRHDVEPLPVLRGGAT